MPTLAQRMSSLKNLPFGADQAYGGSSNEPYIKHPSYTHDLTGVSDAITHTATNVVRITKFLVDAPKGPLFIAKQMGLQMMNPEMEHRMNLVTNKPTTGQGLFNNVSNTVSNAANQIQNKIGSNRVWSPVNFMAQIAVGASGKNIPRHGLSLSVADSDKYQYIAKQNQKSGNNRIINLTKTLMTGGYPAEGAKAMFSYTGGASSFLGIGKTTINSYYSTFAASDTSNPDSVQTLNGFRPIAPLDILNIDEAGVAATEAGSPAQSLRNTDFRAYKVATDPVYAAQVKKDGTRITDYTKYNTATRIGVINPNAKNGPEKRQDGVNMVSLYYAQNPWDTKKDINGNDVNAAAIRDMIKFRIKAIDNDNPGFGMYMIFRAFLNSLSDNMDAEWKQTKYTGRGESFYSYDGFTANYSLGFTVAAFSKDEMKPLYQKLNYLKSTLAPDYKANKMRGNLIELTVGDYIKYQPGIITSLSVGVPEDAPWEIAMNEPDAGNLDKDMHELPQILKVEMSFTPIYNFLPRKSSHAPFIGIDDSENKSKTPSIKEWLIPAVNKDFNDR